MADRRRCAHDASMETTMKPSTPRHLTRSRNDRMLAGVAGGIAETYGFDPILVRLAFVVLTLATFGTAVVAYVVAWLIVPEADAHEPVLTSALRDARHRPRDGRLWIGIALVLIGAATLANRFAFRGLNRVVWPLLLIGGGSALLLLRDRDGSPDGSAPEPPVVAGPAPPAAPASTPETSESSEPSEASESRDSTQATEPSWPPGPPGPPPPLSAYPPSRPWPEPSRPRLPRVRRERSMLGRFTWSALLIVAGAAWLLDLTGAAAVDVRLVLAIELAIVGVALLAGAWYGRARSLIVFGIVLSFFAGAFAALDVPLRGDIGEHVVQPRTVGSLDGRYHLAIGHLELDLRDTALDGEAHRVVLTDAIGFIEVFVPADARVEVKARADIGSVDILGRPEKGGSRTHTFVIDDPPGSSGPRIVIDAHVGFGAVNVTRGPGSVEVSR